MFDIENIRYTQSEMDFFFSRSLFVDKVSGGSIQKYHYQWKYSNRVLIRVYNEIFDVYAYIGFLYHSNTDEYQYLYEDKNMDSVIDYCKDFWNPPAKYPEVNRLEMALEMIQNNILGIFKTNGKKQYTKHSFCYEYYASDGNWHAFYPDTNVLVDFHMSYNKDNLNQNYIDFLQSDELKILRQQWN